MLTLLALGELNGLSPARSQLSKEKRMNTPTLIEMIQSARDVEQEALRWADISYRGQSPWSASIGYCVGVRAEHDHSKNLGE